MKTKVFFLLFLGLFLVAGAGLASASLTDAQAYYAFDTGSGSSAVDSSGNSNTGTIYGASWTSEANAKLGDSALSFDGTDDYVDTKITLSSSPTFSFSYWYKPNETGRWQQMGYRTSSSNAVHFSQRGDNNYILFSVAGASGNPQIQTSSPVSIGTWYHVVGTYTPNSLKLYVDGVLIGTSTTVAGSLAPIEFYVGARNTDGAYYKATFDEVAYYDRVLNATEISELYNSGTGFNPYAPVGGNNFSVSAVDVYANSSISNFSLFVYPSVDSFESSLDGWSVSDTSGVAGRTNYWSTDGDYSLRLRAFSGLGSYSDSASKNDLGNGFFEFDALLSGQGSLLVQVNGTTVKTIPTGLESQEQEFLNVVVENITNSDEISFALSPQAGWTLNVYVDNIRYGSESFSTTNGNITTNIPKNSTSLHNLLFVSNQGSYFDRLYESVNVTTNLEAELYPWTKIFAKEITTNNTINNFTINFKGFNYTTTTGVASIPLFNETKEVFIDAPGFAFETINLTANHYLQNHTFLVYISNTVNIRFLDEITTQLITDRNITAFFTGEIESYNLTTSNGTATLNLIQPQRYVVTYNAENYTQRRYSFGLENRTFEDLTLYLLKEDKAEIVLVNVKDTFLTPVDNANVRVQRKNLAGTNYYTVETCDTDNLGECLQRLELFNTIYRFQVLVNEQLIFTSVDQEIKGTTITFIVDLSQDSFNQIISNYQVTGTVSFDEPTSTFSYDYVHIGGTDITSCLRVTLRNRGVTSLINNECVSGSSSGVITHQVDMNATGDYEARGYIINSPQNTIASLVVSTAFTFSSQIGLMGLFLFAFFVAGIASFTGLFNPAVPPVILIGVIWLFAYIQFISVGIAVIGSLAVGAAIVIFITRN